ncbi:MAG TPA: M20/M25/M40 family metallo-hydrolase [Actinomycetota bacterium]|nr:M20/M25/M40 family metallo-hydrolase [Actinomycetota bacterium]
MFNVHLDTVAGGASPSIDGGRFLGRGAIDAKGPAVALLAGIRTAAEAEPGIADGSSVLIQPVAGEEGGAMRTIGTRPLVRRGFVGRLNIFCEPTGLRYLPRASAAATALVRVEGRDAIDDRPDRGHNATVLLGFLAQHLARSLSPPAGGSVCIGGIHTGALHNRVYGTGELLVNIAYPSQDEGRRLELALEERLGDGLARFARCFSDAASVTRLEWLKHGLPTLASTDPGCEALVEGGAGIGRWRDDEPAFACDAIWMHDVPGSFTAVLGPGDLALNHAHAPEEFADIGELEDFASAIARLLVGFARARAERRDGRP